MQESTGTDPMTGLPPSMYHPSSSGRISRGHSLDRGRLLGDQALVQRAPPELHRAGSWSIHGASIPQVGSGTPWDTDTPIASPPTLSSGRRRPRRTLTDNATEFLHAVDDLLGSNVPRHAPPVSHIMSPADGVRSPASPFGPPPIGMSEHPFAAAGLDAPSLRLGAPKFGFSMPNSAVGSPRIRPQEDRFLNNPSSSSLSADWPAPSTTDPEYTRSMWSSVRLPGQVPDPLLYGAPSGSVLSSSPDETTAPLHAETSVAIALGDDEPHPNATQSPPFAVHSRPEVFERTPTFSSIDHDLASRMRSMTLPVDLSIPPLLRDRAGSMNRLHESPPPGHRVAPRNASKTGAHAMYSPYVPSPPPPLSFSSAAAFASPSSVTSPNIPDSPEAVPFEHAMSPRSMKRREDGKWFGRPGTLRLGDTVQVGPSSSSSSTPTPAAASAAAASSTTAPAVSAAPAASVEEDTMDPINNPGMTAPSQLGRAKPNVAHDVHGVAESFDASMRRRNSARSRTVAHAAAAYEGAVNGGRFHRREDGASGPLRTVPPPLQEGAGHWDFGDVRGQLAEISMDQHGSRLVQEKLDHCTPEERTLVFEELFPESRRLMADVFGNYVIQKLLEYGTREQVHMLGEQLEGHVLPLSLGTYGCRVVQKAFERVDEKQKIRLGQELHPFVLDCVRDQNANHVIQKILEQVPSTHLDFIAAAFRGHVQILASHCYSCRVLQRIFAYCSEDQRRPLLDEMHRDTLRLMQDQYGNYVVQWVLQHGDERDRLAIVRVTKTHLLPLSRHKFASNVVEHVIQVAPPKDLTDLLEELLAPLSPSDAEGLPLLLEGTSPLCIATIMMQDQYANYVLQRFLQTLHGHNRERLVQTIRPVLYALRQRQAILAAQTNAASPYTASIRIPGGGHIGNKPLQAIERLIEQGP